MNYPAGIMPRPGNPLILINLEYDPQGRVIKHWNGLIPANPATGYGFVFYEGLYDEVTYQENQITILKKDTLKNINANPDLKVITMEYDKMVRYTRERTNYITYYDTTWLYYNHHTLFRTVTKDRGSILTKDFFFDNEGNLSEIKSLAISRYMGDSIYFQSEKFSDYDSSPNPVRHLAIFDETFERSLSKNNYRKYTMKKYEGDSVMIGDAFRNWTFAYDEKGNVQFDK